LLKTLITKPSHFPKKLQGIDIYDYQGFSSFLSQLKTKPDIIHLHNLHGDFFDLRLLPKLSSEFPIFLSIHDFWLITGYCASFFSCMEWIKGCENCSILSNVGRLFKDTSHKNWLKKRDIFINSSIHLIYPAHGQSK
jgi:glycosyltransferase involved in cell wall biosynthesis